MEAKLIKIDRNGSKHYEGVVTCDRCGGAGYYAIAICNGAPYEAIPIAEGQIPYSAWVASVTYQNGNYRTFNTFEGNPY